MTEHRIRTGVAERARTGTGAVKQRYAGSSAEALTHRLAAVDVINRGMLFASILLLCFFPFLIVMDAAAGRSTVDGFARRLGLNHQAAADVGHLFGPASSTSAAVTGASYVIFIIAGIAAAAALQDLYERSFGLQSRGIRDTPRRLMWLGILIGASLLAGWAGPHLRHSAGPVVLAIVGLAVITAFWWLTMWVLLSGRMPWRELLPAALATALFWIGMEIVFSLTFSGMVTSNQQKYGPIGVVFALMSWLIAIGVVVMLGAVVGLLWQERRQSRSASQAPEPEPAVAIR